MSNTKDSPVLYTEDTQTPTNINTTSQAPVTRGDDGVILDQYQDQNNQSQYASAPNTTTSAKDSATGSGLTAAEGTEYSWDTKAKERADLSYKSDVLEAKSNYLTNRQELENQGQQSQAQIAMNKYSQNQSNEKAGWTGGYILDTERQMAYLKQTIQSQMYGAMELQKYGYDTSLAAARLAYDTNKYDLALEYYNTALSRAVSEAEITGYYVSPETSEMLDDYSIASKILNDDTATEEEKLRADKVLASVYEWFESNGISKQGVETYSHLVEERTHRMSLDKLYTYLDENQTQISTDTFIKVDANGNKIYGETDLEKINFDSMDASSIMEYIYSGADGSLNTVAKDQYLSRLDSISYETENNFTSWCKSQGYIDDKGNVNSSKDLNDLFSEYISNTDTVTKLEKEIQKLESADPEQLKEVINDWECTIEFPDGTSKTLTLMLDGSGIKATDTEVKDNIIQDEQGLVVMKTQDSSADIIKLLNSDQYSTFYNSLLDDTLDLSSNETFAETFSTWASRIVGGVGAVGGGVIGGIIGTLFGPVGTAVGATAGVAVGAIAGNAVGEAVGQIVSLVSDVFNSDNYKKQLEVLNALKEGYTNTIGAENMALLKADYERYNNMSDRDKALLTPAEKETLEKVHEFYSRIEAIDKAIDYADDRDSDMFTDPWDYIGDSWKQSVSNWDDGYQVGDVTRTVVKGAGAVVKTVGSVIVGGFKWLFGIKNKK